VSSQYHEDILHALLYSKGRDKSKYEIKKGNGANKRRISKGPEARKMTRASTEPPGMAGNFLA
jgi:hypothetical protein